MKKTLILTSVVALAACGGGSGGGNAPGVQNSGMRVSSDAILSNKNVTSMASEILVAKNGTVPDIVRSASVVNGGTEYIAYHLDDATFFDSDMDVDDGEYIKFGVDKDGQIDKISWHRENIVESVDRDGPDTNVFTENVWQYRVGVHVEGQPGMQNWYDTDSLPVIDREYSKAEIKEAFREKYGDSLTPEDYVMLDTEIDNDNMTRYEYTHHNVINLQGKDMPESNKLRYADFGYTTILDNDDYQNNIQVGEDTSTIFGGYDDIKEIKHTQDFRDMNFTGKAIAVLGPAWGNGDTLIETADTATTLSIDNNGTQTLTMPFDNYYTISVEKPQNGNETISWTGSTTTGYDLGNPSQNTNQTFNIKYYGDDGVPSEAVGGIFFQNNNVEFNGAFGVKN